VVGLLVGLGVGLAIAAGRDGGSGTTMDPGAGVVEDVGIPVATDVTGDPLPAIEVETLAGDPVQLTELAGAPLVLNLWYSTCAPCVREMPEFEAVHQQLGDEVRIVGINPVDSASAAREFADDVGVTYELLRDPAGDATVALGVARFPTTVFVDSGGRIVATEPNELDAAELTERIEELFPA
jgi:peroxiredoxin